MSWDSVYSWSQALAVFFAAVALVSGFVVNKRQGKEMALLKDSTAAQEGKNLKLEQGNIEAQRALEAERTKRLEFEKLVRSDRHISLEKSLPILKDGEKGTAVILYPPGNNEAARFAKALADLLRQGEWRAVEKMDDSPDPTLIGMRIEITWDSPARHSNPHVRALLAALTASQPDCGQIDLNVPSPTRPPQSPIVGVTPLVIVVGAKY
jgi:hypothetical protein